MISTALTRFFSIDENVSFSKQNIVPLAKLLQPRNIEAKAFSRGELKLMSPLSEHTDWAYKNIYNIPYPKGKKRTSHGIQHVARAALYVPALVNLYRHYGDAEAKTLTAADLQLIQIAVLFHDSARMADGVDKWDAESGQLFYHYLTQVLQVDEDTALKLSDAVANKDRKPPRNIFQKIIHDADCLDVLRARPHFDGTYLFFYQDIAKKNSEAFDDMAQLLREVRSLIEVQGDSYDRHNENIKKSYNCIGAYQKIKMDIVKPEDRKSDVNKLDPRDYYTILPASLTLTSDDFSKKLKQEKMVRREEKSESDALDEKSLKVRLDSGRILIRSIVNGSGFSVKNGEVETNAHKDLRKISRLPEIPTRSKKKNKHGIPLNRKYGSPFRSVSLGGIPYGCCGFFIELEEDKVHDANHTNIGSGRGKKNHLQDIKLTLDEKKKKLNDVLYTQKLGGSSRAYSDHIFNHNEIIYHVHKYSAIYFSQEATRGNDLDCDQYFPLHPHSAPLQAIYLNNEHEKFYKKKLPVFEYSGIHHALVKRGYSEEDIIRMWVEMCKDYIESVGYPAFKLTLNELKILCMFSSVENNKSADDNYEEKLRAGVNEAILKQVTCLRDKALEAAKLEMSESQLSTIQFENAYLTKLAAFPELIDEKKIQEKMGKQTLVLLHEWNKNRQLDNDDGLGWAVKNGHIEMVKILLALTIKSKKIIPVIKTNNLQINSLFDTYKAMVEKGITKEKINVYLKRAIILGNDPIVDLMILSGGDVNETMLAAAKAGDEKIVKALLQRGADINYTDSAGDTALGWAAYKGHVSIVDMLLKKGGKLDHVNKSGVIPLYEACAEGRVEVVKCLLEKYKENKATSCATLMTSLHIALKKNQPELIRLIFSCADFLNEIQKDIFVNKLRFIIQSRKDDNNINNMLKIWYLKNYQHHLSLSSFKELYQVDKISFFSRFGIKDKLDKMDKMSDVINLAVTEMEKDNYTKTANILLMHVYR
jgi:hypothetical protein